MRTDTSAPVVVGVDGSPAALAAVRLAAREAALRKCPLRLVHAFIWPQLKAPRAHLPAGPPEGGLRQQAERTVADAVAEATRAAPDRVVIDEIVDGSPAPVLLRESRRAGLLVLGYHGLGAVTGALIGSVATQVAGHAACPVMVARGENHADGPVMVGVDGSPWSERAVAFAAEEAALRAARLVVLHARNGPLPVATGDPEATASDVDASDADEEVALTATVAALRARHPQVPMTHRLVQGRATRVFVAESAGAQLMVVGARGRGGFPGLRLGGVSQAVLHHGSCPLTIVQEPQP
ncbi:Nucleotide-binding universal stress protein, UspA family [Micromonospora pattaloongensis]|uniref:Nucleotide-binding universal stress protein, UspA family n=1 Tax=Micromonospora pattaloongensis TaxID=405436 RepID=A0A1H3JJT4_9ACTN|nr:universal stress protein [Micromonospora pattaloongensis]SDY39678.1 Nucleotide-binding universal stress protein, UspA family [Micromonospora pattaloongensis]